MGSGQKLFTSSTNRIRLISCLFHKGSRWCIDYESHSVQGSRIFISWISNFRPFLINLYFTLWIWWRLLQLHHDLDSRLKNCNNAFWVHPTMVETLKTRSRNTVSQSRPMSEFWAWRCMTSVGIRPHTRASFAYPPPPPPHLLRSFQSFKILNAQYRVLYEGT